MYRMILNETSYFGAGCRESIAVEAARRGFKKAFFVTDKDLIRFKVADKVVEVFEKNNIGLFLAMGKRDEINSYEERIKPALPRLEKLKKSFIFTPDWVYNGDHGIASINFGFEMGQHCITNAMHCNLMFDDGTPMEPRLPKGITGWLAEALKD